METDFSDYSQATTSGPDFSSADMGLSQEAMDSIGSSQNQDESFFGGSDFNTMDFGRGSVSNITNAANYDPNFAALGMIGRGLTPGMDLRNQISFDVPSSMLPSLEGKYYSPVEKALVEMEPVGIMSMIGQGFKSIMDSAKSSFNDAKNALGLTGDAKGGLKDEDFTGLMGTRDDQQISDMSQTGAQMNVTDPVVSAPASVNMGALPQVSPLFDQFGNPYRTRADRNAAEAAQQVLSGGIASVAPLPQLRTDFRREIVNNKPMFSGTTYTGPGGSYTFSETMGQIKPRGGVGAVRSPDVYSEGNFDGVEDDIMEVADANTFNVLQGLGTRFEPQINDIIQRNISPRLRFDTAPRRDTNDPNKMMPFMGLTYDFSTA